MGCQMDVPEGADGVRVVDGVELPYVLVSVTCTARDCPAFGIAHTVMMFPGGQPPVCGPCLKAPMRRTNATHFVHPDDLDRVHALPIPEEWQC
jgi:hypothetical protein